MTGEVTLERKGGSYSVPAIIAAAGDAAARRFLEFFTTNIRNPNTRAAYAQAVPCFDLDETARPGPADRGAKPWVFMWNLSG